MATRAATEPSTVWWVFLLQGLAGVLLGMMLLTEPDATLVALTTLLGFYWLITGVLALVRVFADHAVPWIWPLLVGVIGVASGILVLNHPLLAAVSEPTVLISILGADGTIMGVLDIIGSFTGGVMGSFILGAINMLVGVLLLSSPVTAALSVPLVFGMLLLAQGIALTVWALRTRAKAISTR